MIYEVNLFKEVPYMSTIQIMKEQSSENSKYFYELANKTAINLEPSNFVRVGILINYCIFIANNMKNPEAAVSKI